MNQALKTAETLIKSKGGSFSLKTQVDFFFQLIKQQ